MRRALLIALASWLASGVACERSGSASHPNVILISIDTLRRDGLGCYGRKVPISPRIDELAARSIVFDEAIAQAPWTLPSHASLLASLYPSVLDLGSFVRPAKLSPKARTLAEVLRDAGYATFAIVAGGFLAAETGLDQGFDDYDAQAGSMRVAVDGVIEKLASRDRTRPFFAFLHTYDVHKYDPPAEDRSRFVTSVGSKLVMADRGAIAKLMQGNDSLAALAELKPNDWRYVRELYDAATHSVDREIGRLLVALRAAGIEDRTIVIITSDHGEEFLEHGRGGHGYNLHDENLRVPLIVFDPERKAARIGGQVGSIDVAPTLVERLGLEVPGDWLGRSVLRFVDAPDGRAPSLPAFSESAHLPFKSVRFQGRKLIVSLRRPHRTMFDLAADPGEQRDVFDPEDPLAQKLVESLRAWIVACAAEQRFRNTGEAALDSTERDRLSALGYTGAAESIPAEAAPWLAALAGDSPAGAMRTAPADESPPKPVK